MSKNHPGFKTDKTKSVISPFEVADNWPRMSWLAAHGDFEPITFLRMGARKSLAELFWLCGEARLFPLIRGNSSKSGKSYCAPAHDRDQLRMIFAREGS